MPIVIFLIGIVATGDVTILKFACTHGPRFLTGTYASNKLTAATLQAAMIALAVSAPRRRATARDSFLGCLVPPSAGSPRA